VERPREPIASLPDSSEVIPPEAGWNLCGEPSLAVDSQSAQIWERSDRIGHARDEQRGHRIAGHVGLHFGGSGF
jgi:hypothetical protein